VLKNDGVVAKRSSGDNDSFADLLAEYKKKPLNTNGPSVLVSKTVKWHVLSIVADQSRTDIAEFVGVQFEGNRPNPGGPYGHTESAARSRDGDCEIGTCCGCFKRHHLGDWTAGSQSQTDERSSKKEDQPRPEKTLGEQCKWPHDET
jgi:hypothetical protein